MRVTNRLREIMDMVAVQLGFERSHYDSSVFCIKKKPPISKQLFDELQKEPPISKQLFDELQDAVNYLENWEKDLCEKENLLVSKQKDLLKKEERIRLEKSAAIQSITSEKESLSNLKVALYDVEYRIMDYVKRFESEEISLFNEIRYSADKFNKYNASAPKDGFLFEQETAELLKQNGFENVVVTQKSGDYGADITAEKDDIRYVIQCKYYSTPVGIEAVQQIYGAKPHYNAHVAVVATNSVFTKAAEILAEETGVLLWDCEKLDEMRPKNT